MNIVLASTSPRRKKLLSDYGIDFVSISPDYDEKFENLDFSFEKIEQVSLNKALSIKDKISNDALIISADTVVVQDEKILLKPKDEKDAFLMLKTLSGKKHYVVTGYTIYSTNNDKKIVSHVKSYVEFAKLTDEQINDYIKNFKPLDKAGAYGLQELPDYFEAKVEGSANNIIGLPVEEIIDDLKKF